MKRLLSASLVILGSTIACAQQPAATTDGSADVVARYGDQVITDGELDVMVKAKVIALRQQEYDIKRQQLEQTVFERLVDQAASAEGLTTEQYLQREVSEKLAQPSDEEIQKVLDQYRSRLNPDEEKAREQVVSYLQQQQQGQLNTALKESLFNAANVQFMLEPIRFEAVVTDQHPTRGGDASAPVTIIEYTDFQCPFCSRVQPTIDAVLEQYGGSVRHVFKELPLPMHAQAKLGAEAALCAGDQGQFWEMHDWLFANKNSINRDALAAQGATLGLDVDEFNGCIDAEKYSRLIEEDMQEANSFGITGTPGFLINGRVLRGAVPLEQFQAVINEELRKAGVEVPEPKAADTGDAS